MEVILLFYLSILVLLLVYNAQSCSQDTIKCPIRSDRLNTERYRRKWRNKCKNYEYYQARCTCICTKLIAEYDRQHFGGSNYHLVPPSSAAKANNHQNTNNKNEESPPGTKEPVSTPMSTSIIITTPTIRLPTTVATSQRTTTPTQPVTTDAISAYTNSITKQWKWFAPLFRDGFAARFHWNHFDDRKTYEGPSEPLFESWADQIDYSRFDTVQEASVDFINHILERAHLTGFDHLKEHHQSSRQQQEEKGQSRAALIENQNWPNDEREGGEERWRTEKMGHQERKEQAKKAMVQMLVEAGERRRRVRVQGRSNTSGFHTVSSSAATSPQKLRIPLNGYTRNCCVDNPFHQASSNPTNSNEIHYSRHDDDDQKSQHSSKQPHLHKIDAATRDFKVCCLRQGISKRCRHLCTYQMNKEKFEKYGSECADDLAKWQYCSSNAHHTANCCRNSGISRDCLDLCNGYVDLACVNIIPVIRDCFNIPEDFRRILSCQKAARQAAEPAMANDSDGIQRWHSHKKFHPCS